MTKIAILCKAGFLTGMGHVVRQIHLGRVLRSRGMDIEFFITDHPPSIELLRRENFSAKIIAKVEDLPGELDATYALALLDIQDTKKDFIGALRERAGKIMSFEDLGDGRNHVDLLVDCNLEPEQAQYLKPPVKALFGLPYSVLAEEFGQYHRRKKIFSESLETLLVTMGGTDPNNLTMQLAQCFLQSRKKTSITFVAGPGFQRNTRAHSIGVFGGFLSGFAASRATWRNFYSIIRRFVVPAESPCTKRSPSAPPPSSSARSWLSRKKPAPWRNWAQPLTSAWQRISTRIKFHGFGSRLKLNWKT